MIPLLSSRPYDDGYDWIERLPRGWHVVASWGEDGWDLGSWPYVVIAVFASSTEWAHAVYVEGDISVHTHESQGELVAAIDEVAEFYWRTGQYSSPDDLPEGKGLLPRHRGPYGRKR